MILDAAQRARLARELERRGIAAPPRDDAPDTVSADGLPLSSEQSRMYFAQRLAPESAAYNVPYVLVFTGPVDADALAAAVGDVVALHPILHTVYRTGDDGLVRQYTEPERVLCVERRRVSGTASEQTDAVDEIAHAQMIAPFDLAADLPVRAAVVTGDDLTALTLSIHHIAFDGGSTDRFFADLAACYRTRTGAGGGPDAVGGGYHSYVRSGLGAAPGVSDHWRRHLDGLPDSSVLPALGATDGTGDDRGALVMRTLPPTLGRAVLDTAAGIGCPPLVLLWAAVALVLRDLGAGDRFAVGMPVSTREAADHADTIGVFVNTIALPTDLSPDTALGDLLDALTAEYREHVAHSADAFDEVARDLASRRRHRLFEVMINTTTPARIDLGIDGTTVRSRPPLRMSAPFPVTVGIYHDDDGPGVSLLYQRARIDADRAERLLGAVLGALAQLVFHPDLSVAQTAAFAASARGRGRTSSRRRGHRRWAAGHDGAGDRSGGRRDRTRRRTGGDRRAARGGRGRSAGVRPAGSDRRLRGRRGAASRARGRRRVAADRSGRPRRSGPARRRRGLGRLPRRRRRGRRGERAGCTRIGDGRAVGRTAARRTLPDR
ncbi:condensation domain-containing protein [Gordonia humi]|uniref:condensation domain-containing protein n=1 Tax=Gordonia humi TaxID=686429 RepID=UPI0036199202